MITWQDARAEAARRVEQLPLPPGDLTGLSIQLNDYDNLQTMRFDHGMASDLDDHRVILRAMSRLLKTRGANVTEFTTTLDMVMQWKKGAVRKELLKG